MNLTHPTRAYALTASLAFLAAAGCASSVMSRGIPKPVSAVATAQAARPVKAGKEEIRTTTVVPKSILDKNTLLAIYGRGFGRAPILGRLGQYKDIEVMAGDVQQWVKPIRKENGNKGVLVGIHLIYALAIPCVPKSPECLLYLDAIDKQMVEHYIEPAARLGWVVILDTQLGKSNPLAQVKRMISRGYLKYDNVHVAVDPEFHARGAAVRPGIPIGTVEAARINDVQELLDDYVRKEGLPSRKILIVHQFGDENVRDGVPFMIQNKKELKTYENIELVINADGFGKQPVKVVKYNKMTDSTVYPFIKFRGIKIFYPNRWEKGNHSDKPPLTIPQVFGSQVIPGKLKMKAKPDVVIIA